MDGRQRMMPDEALLRIVEDMREKGVALDTIRRTLNVSHARWERLMGLRDEQLAAAREAAQPKPLIGERIQLCRVGQSLRCRLGAGPTDEAIRDMARAYHAKMAEQVAARSASQSLSGQVSSHRPQNMPGANT